MANVLLDVKNLRTEFRVDKKKSVTAVNDVSFQIGKGEIIGLVGESGCGKSVTSMSIMRLLADTSGRTTNGEVIFRGENILDYTEKRMREIRGGEISMIFQDPMSSLNPPIRIENQMIETIQLHQECTREQARQKASDMLREVGIPDVENTLRSYPHQLSGGMCQRVMIAMAMSCKPELLIADEPTTALDVTIQAQILDLMKNMQKEEGASILLITHDLGVVAQMCSRVLVMYAGRIVEQADVRELFHHPVHPYTRGLIACVPKIGSEMTRLPSIPGQVPDLAHMPKGCKFAPRCRYATDLCREKEPDLVPFGGDAAHRIRCFRAEELWKELAGADGKTQEEKTGAPQANGTAESHVTESRTPQANGAGEPRVTVSEAPQAKDAGKSGAKSGEAAQAESARTPGEQPLLSVRDIVKTFEVNRGLFSKKKSVHAVNHVSFDIRAGETFSLVGESGCGKSTTARLVNHLLVPDSGDIFFDGKNIAKMKEEEARPIRGDMQMIFQDPYGSLDPRMKIADLIEEPLLLHTKMTPTERRQRVAALLGTVGLPAIYGERYPHEFSGGQRQRVGIARALSVNPKLIIADEPVSALDVSIQAQVLNLMQDLQEKYHLTYLFISHDLSVVELISDRIGVMYLGTIVETAPKNEIFRHPEHPYTKALLSAVPAADPDHPGSRIELKGELPSPVNPPSGCLFHTRCPYCTERCKTERPELHEIAPGHFCRCHLMER